MTPELDQAVVDEVLLRLRGDEEVRRYAYDDATGKEVRAPEGKLTIGCGVNLSIGLDDHEIDWLERHRLHVGMLGFAERASGLGPPVVLRLLPRPAQVALGLMVFQLGVDGVLAFHRMLVAVATRDWSGAAAEAKASRWAEQTPKRAHEVAVLFSLAGQPEEEGKK